MRNNATCISVGLLLGALSVSAAARAGVIEKPFAVHRANEWVDIETALTEDRVYPFSLQLGFKPDDRADRERVMRLAGVPGTAPGFVIALHVRVGAMRGDREDILIDQQILAGRTQGWSATDVTRHLGYVRLLPGRYRFSFRTFGEQPDLSGTPVSVVMQTSTRGDVFQIFKSRPSVEMAKLLADIKDGDLLNNPTGLRRLRDNSSLYRTRFSGQWIVLCGAL
jgi:hypothetical protein